MDSISREGNELFKRTKAFAIRAIRLVDSLPKASSDVIGKQLLRSVTSVGANHRAACRGRSPAEFCAKLGIVEEEADECTYWLELLADASIFKRSRLDSLIDESNQFVAMVVASIRTVRKRIKK